MNDREIIESIDYAKVFNELKKDVRASQLRAMRSVNKELIMLSSHRDLYFRFTKETRLGKQSNRPVKQRPEVNISRNERF